METEQKSKLLYETKRKYNALKPEAKRQKIDCSKQQKRVRNVNKGNHT